MSSAAATAPWPWSARLPAIVFAYGGAVAVVLGIEYMLRGPTAAAYAVYAVVPGLLAAGIAVFLLSFRPRRRLTLLAASVLVALLPLAVIAFTFDFQEFLPAFLRRAAMIGAMEAVAVVVATGLLTAAGAFGNPTGDRPA